MFGFKDFDDFNEKYFSKELAAFEEFHKIRQLKYARIKYSNRFSASKIQQQAHSKDRDYIRHQNQLQQVGA